MKKLIVLTVLLIGCNANVVGSSEGEFGGSGGSESSTSSGNETTIISHPSTDICFQHQGDCKYIDSCQNGKITWKFEPSDVPISNDLCIHFECKCFNDDCKPIKHFELNGTSCGTDKYCLNGVCNQ